MNLPYAASKLKVANKYKTCCIACILVYKPYSSSVKYFVIMGNNKFSE